MTTRAAKKKREQRQRAKDGKMMLSIEVHDLETWKEYLRGADWLPEGQDDAKAIGIATECFIYAWCSRYRGKGRELMAQRWQRPACEPPSLDDVYDDPNPEPNEFEDRYDNGVDEADLDLLDSQ